MAEPGVDITTYSPDLIPERVHSNKEPVFDVWKVEVF